MSDFRKAASIEDMFEYAKAEVHDGDIVMIRIKDPVPEKQLRVFREAIARQTDELGWKERGILCLVVNGNVDFVRDKGPARVEPQPNAKFDLKRGMDDATNLLGHVGLDVSQGSNIRAIVSVVLAAVATQLDGDERDGD